MKKIKAIIIDDERNARDEVRRLLENYPDIEITGEARNADDAASLVALTNPDILFLDIQMPGKSGFDLLETLEHVPQVIFTTAFDNYAVKAFEVSAIDYLMKPIREERFEKAIKQVRLKLGAKSNSGQIFVKDRQQYHFIQWDRVHLIESMDNYARLYFDDKNVFLKSSLNQLEKKLDPEAFFRINRAQIINLNFIEKIKSPANDTIKFVLKTGYEYEASTRQSIKFKSIGRANK